MGTLGCCEEGSEMPRAEAGWEWSCRTCPVGGGRWGGRSVFRRGLTVQQGLLRLVAFPGVCIFMLIGSLRCVCC